MPRGSWGEHVIALKNGPVHCHQRVEPPGLALVVDLHGVGELAALGRRLPDQKYALPLCASISTEIRETVDRRTEAEVLEERLVLSQNDGGTRQAFPGFDCQLEVQVILGPCRRRTCEKQHCRCKSHGDASATLRGPRNHAAQSAKNAIRMMDQDGPALTRKL